MTALTCRRARRMLQAYHDGELSVPEQIAVASHADRCERCAEALCELDDLQTSLRDALRGRMAVTADEHTTFESTVVARFRAEESVTLAHRARDWFSDMRLVYAGMAATVGALVCSVAMFNMMRLATVANSGPHSFAAIVNVLGPAPVDPAARAIPLVVDARMLMPEALNTSIAVETETAAMVSDAALAVAYVVTREGRVTNVELIDARSGLPVDADTRSRLWKLTGAVSRESYRPARLGSLPVAVNMMRLVANTTVRARVIITEGTAVQVLPLRKRTSIDLPARPATGRT